MSLRSGRIGRSLALALALITSACGENIYVPGETEEGDDDDDDLVELDDDDFEADDVELESPPDLPPPDLPHDDQDTDTNAPPPTRSAN